MNKELDNALVLRLNKDVHGKCHTLIKDNMQCLGKCS
jgi:hypothetical protein